MKAISSLERGERRRPYPHTVRALAAGLGLSQADRDALLGSLTGRRPRAGPSLADQRQRDAAWEIYVELVTRIAVADLRSNQGMLREALSSLYSLFASTRSILRQYGPALAHPPDDSTPALDRLATVMLNDVLRPVLSRWHPLLLEHENRRPPGVSASEHERAWSRNAELREELSDLRATLSEYAQSLAGIAGVPPAD